jgi:hypothetical protein
MTEPFVTVGTNEPTAAGRAHRGNHAGHDLSAGPLVIE